MNRGRQIAGWLAVAAATYGAAFVLPFRFPLREPVWSNTYIAGSNNQVAAVAVAVVSVLVLVVLWLPGGVGRSDLAGQEVICNSVGSGVRANDDICNSDCLSRKYLVGGVAAAVVWTAALGSAVARGHMYWGDEGYFLNQLRTGIVFHQPIYRGFEFAYGPLLYWWPALWVKALGPLGVSMTAAYLVALALAQAAGVGLLFYVVQALPLRRELKLAAFVLVAFGTLNSLLGLNYTLFRFLPPLALVVLLSRQKRLGSAVLVAGVGEVAALLVSPELGLAFGGAAATMACWQAWRGETRRLLVLPAVLAGAGMFALLVGRDYFSTLGHMAKGGFNLLLTPAPHILALLLAVVALAPLAVARALRRDAAESTMLLGMYVAALGLLPAALGRCDAIHCFFDGIGMYLLSFVALDAAGVRWRKVWVGAVAAVFVFTQAKNFRLYEARLGLVLRRHAVVEDEGFEEARLLTALGGARVSAPVLLPQRVLDDLAQRRQYVPGYYCGWVGVWDAESEKRVIADVRRTPFALVAFEDPPEA